MKTVNFVNQHADYEAANTWKKRNLETNLPPVQMQIGDKYLSDLSWQRMVVTSETFTDYPTDHPVQRTEQKVCYVTDGLQIDMQVSSYPNYPVVEYVTSLTNTSSEPTPLIRNVLAIDTVITNDNNPILHYNYGSKVSIFDFEPRKEGAMSFASDSGRPTHMFLSNFNVESKDGGVIAVMSWLGCWKADFMPRVEGFKMTAGQRFTEFVLLPGETIQIPRIVLLFYKGTWIEGQNVWRRWFYMHNSMRFPGVRMKLHTYTGIGGRYPNMLGNAADDIAFVQNEVYKTGLSDIIDTFDQDAGWYHAPLGIWQDTGNWYPDPERYPNGMSVVVDKFHECNVNYSLWFEPERFCCNCSTNVRAIKEALGADRILDMEPESDSPHLGLINYGKPGVVDYVVDLLDKLINEGHVDMYRQDFNADPAPSWRYQDIKETNEAGVPRYGITENHYVTGHFEMWTKLSEHHPGMVFDVCAGGGMRLDLDSLRFGFPHTKSDMAGNAIANQNQMYGLAMWYVLYGGGPKDLRDDWERRSSLVTSLGFALKPEISAEEIKKYVADWASFSKYLLYDFYPLTPYHWWENGHVMSVEFHNPEEGEGMVAIFARGETAKSTHTIKCMGLDADQMYRLHCIDTPEESIILSGRQLMEEGITTEAKDHEDFAYIYFYECTS